MFSYMFRIAKGSDSAGF